MTTKQRWHEKQCPICLNFFETKIHGKKICSRVCKAKDYKIKYAERQAGKFGEGIGDSRLRLRFEVFKRDNFTCQYCGRTPKEDGIKLHADHIIPESKGGLTSAENLTTACQDCNSGKSDILLSQRLIKVLKIA